MTIEPCDKCGAKMKLIKRDRRLLHREEMGEMTDGEDAEYTLAEESEDPGEFGIDQEFYECPKCHFKKIVERI